MKYLFLVIGALMFIQKSEAQVAYVDPAAFTVISIEVLSTEKLKDEYVKTDKEVDELKIPAFLENASRAKLAIVPQTVFPLTYINVCSDYWNPLSRTKKLCDRRYQFLRESERLVREFVNSPTRYRMNRGVRTQIMEEYTEIMNKIAYELELMQVEKDRRSIVRTLFN